jgi:4-hydroxybenzoate polyprenyltransferase
VVSVSFILSLTQNSILGSLEVALAIFFGQCVIGWSNDLIDYRLDLESKRLKKPLVAHLVTPKDLKLAICFALPMAIFLSFVGPLGPKGTAIHAAGLLSATFYNFKLKRTRYSVLPYMFSFGAMPWAIFLGAGKRPVIWLTLGFVAFSSAFHFLNVIKDLNWDISQGVLGLPQLSGKRGSISIATILILAGITFAIILIRQGRLTD